MPKLTLEEDGVNFVLRSANEAGSTNSLTLSADDILTLAQSIPSLRDRVLARRSPAGGSVSAVVMTDVAQIALNTDLHRSEVHLTMIDRHGAQAGYALPPKVARLLADRLPLRVAEIEAAAKTRTRQ
jgi:hypothetical protein